VGPRRRREEGKGGWIKTYSVKVEYSTDLL
jgi:hypothetical protein